MIKIKFTAQDDLSHTKICPMCGEARRNGLLSVANITDILPSLSMAKCVHCGTAYFTDADPVLGYNYSGFEQNYWYNYVQNGAGISAMLEPLLSIDRPRQGCLLDIGCGFGFVPHFWESMGYGKAVGLEMSSYGVVGAEKLGVNIVPKYYSEASELYGRKFDYVFSSEVIEHVENPEAFVREISEALSDDGILIMTTPSASVLNENSEYLTLLATLSPGFHYFIASAESMRSLLLRCGFEHVEVRDAGHRLFVWASKFPLPYIKDGFSDWPTYLNYLQSLSKNSDSHVSGGALYRAIKDSFNLGMFEIAEALYPKFKDLSQRFYGLNFDTEDIIVSKVRDRLNLDNEKFPSWLGCGLLYSGLVEARQGASLERQISLYSAAIEVMEKEIELAAQFAGEPAHFIKMAKKKHKEVFEKIESANTNRLPDKSHCFVLKHPNELSNRNVCLYAAYSSRSKMTNAMIEAVNQLSAQGLDVILCLAVDDTSMDIDLADFERLAGVVIRENKGYDFAAWGCAIRLISEITLAKRVFFINDSVFILPSILPEFIKLVCDEDADFIAATESFQFNHHAQSYFMVFQGRALVSSDFKNYWRNVDIFSDKRDVIHGHELRLLPRVQDEWGLEVKILFEMQDIFPEARPEDYSLLNVSHTYWDYLVSLGLPFVKVELIRDNPIKANILHWKRYFRSYGASVSSALQHIATPRQSADLEVRMGARSNSESDVDRILKKQNRSNFQIILSELNHVRLNARKRRKLKKSKSH